MIDYLIEEKDMGRNDTYSLLSLAVNLKNTEVVDVPHMLVSIIYAFT